MKHEGHYVGFFSPAPTSGRIITSNGTEGGISTSSFSFSESTASVAVSFAGASQTSWTVRRRGNVVFMDCSFSNTSKFSSATGHDSIGTLPSGYRPSITMFFLLSIRNNGEWASATYYPPVILEITSAGAMTIRGNATNIKAAQYLRGTIVFPV